MCSNEIKFRVKLEIGCAIQMHMRRDSYNATLHHTYGIVNRFRVHNVPAQ